MPIKNREERLAYAKAYREANRERIRACRKRKREELSEEELEDKRRKKREYYRQRCESAARKPGSSNDNLRMQRILEKDAEAHEILARIKKKAFDVLCTNQNPYV